MDEIASLRRKMLFGYAVCIHHSGQQKVPQVPMTPKGQESPGDWTGMISSGFRSYACLSRTAVGERQRDLGMHFCQSELDTQQQRQMIANHLVPCTV